MATIITHPVVAIVGGKAIWSSQRNLRFWFWMAIFSILPDADVLGFLYGIEYGDFWGHRGFTHSIVFAFIVGPLFAGAYCWANIWERKNWWKYALGLSLSCASHGLLDGLTNGGLGIAYFSPFDDTRYFLPWTPVQVSPIGVKNFLQGGGAAVLISELIWIVAPVTLVYLVSRIIRKFRK